MHVEKEFNKFGKFLVQQSRSNLTKKDKNASKELYNSIGYKFTKHKNSFTFSFSMEDYGKFVDAGVKGVGGTKANGEQWKKKRVTNSKFKYRNKRPPASAFNGWVVRKGIAPRSASGQFISRKSLQFAIANSVYHTGLETTNFFTRPFELGFDKLADDVVEAFGLDLDNLLEHALNN
jgi:hypothetical protein